MIQDKDLTVCTEFDVTDDDNVTNSVDLGTARDIGPGTTLVPWLRVAEVFATCDSITVKVITSAAVGMGTPTTLYTKTILTAALTANSLHKLPPIPHGVAQRYLGMSFTVDGSNATTGTFSAGFTLDSAQPAR